MRRWLAGGLCLTLCWTVRPALAQEVNWRPAGVSSPQAGATAESSASGVKLRRPEPVAETRRDGPITPIAFRPVASQPAAPIVRATAEAPRPLPRGPELRSEIWKSATPPPVAPPSMTSTEVWGQTTSTTKIVQADPRAKPAPVVSDPGAAMVGPMFFEGDTFSVGSPCGENGCCSPWDAPARRQNCLTLSLGYLLWIIKDSNVLPLAASSPVGTPQSLAGVIGAPGTRVLYGGGDVDHNALSGGKLTLGLALPWWQDTTWETSYFFVGRRVNDFSDASSVLARPITNIRTGNNESILVNYPGTFAGNINIEDRTRLWGVETYFRRGFVGQGWIDVDWLVGYRYLELEQNLNITQQTNGLAGAPAGQANVSTLAYDRFGTRNQFNGLTLGIETEWRFRRWTLGTSYKISMGNVHQTLHVEGNQVFLPGVTTQSVPSGILALPSNIGSYSRDSFTVVPEFGLKLGLNITERLQLYVGYSFLYFGSVLRPGDQIETDINRTQVVVPGTTTTLSGAARPVVPFRTTDFWAQGANFGLEFRY